MKKLLIALVMVMASLTVFAQSTGIVGVWNTIDDVSGEKKSEVEIFKKSDGKYYGKIIHLFVKPENAKCANCKDDRKDQPLLGLEIIRGLKKDGNEFTGGTITDPKTGKTYKCSIVRKGNSLEVRGYVGFSLIGRTQTWTLAR